MAGHGGATCGADITGRPVSVATKGCAKAKPPTDLTGRGWDKLKEVTVPKTGFGDKLTAHDKARKVTQSLGPRNLASFKTAATALKGVSHCAPPDRAGVPTPTAHSPRR
ncbi:MAG: hypothetical protein ABIX46_09485 [Burkholderiaceae bacterium]